MDKVLSVKCPDGTWHQCPAGALWLWATSFHRLDQLQGRADVGVPGSHLKCVYFLLSLLLLAGKFLRLVRDSLLQSSVITNDSGISVHLGASKQCFLPQRSISESSVETVFLK